ncbi:flocculation protein FLO11-like isoform X2 [Trichoplusia ni]|uniref:Flocculation protein FLO11-like isoform X2 n=1 Tax=Trichoplusia ni TaxID=7111 RepID=A0A7E5VDH1_TRINI|nr:flocculation protein FLO11-like isoform X2 [Trichoplusia ni]
MSSTSSSDCDNCDYCQCGRSLDNNYSYDCYGRPIISSRHVPFCSNVGSIHPLIYYAEVVVGVLIEGSNPWVRNPDPAQRRNNCLETISHRPNRRQRCDQPRKEKNCFVKAFEWYTQERIPASPKTCPAAERCGFANWLDSKYIEYLHDSRMEQHVYQLTTQPTTTIEPCATCPSPEPCTTTKRFPRMKSPWRKRRRSCKDSGDVPEKCLNQSCEFIMQPKDLTRAASDCCYPTTNSGCNKSNATVMSSNPPGTLRGTGKSFSMTSVCRETNQNPIDIIPSTVQEGSKTKPPNPPPPSPDQKTCCECREKIQQVPSKPMKSKKTDVSCQCPEEKVVPVDETTQYECLCLRTKSSKTNVNPDAGEPLTCCKCAGVNEPASDKTRSKRLSKSDIKPTFVPSTQEYTSKKKEKQVHVFCQCPEETVVTVDTPTQYQPAAAPTECVCGARNSLTPNANVPNVVAAPNNYGSSVCAPTLRTSSVYTPTIRTSNVCDPTRRTSSVCDPTRRSSGVCEPTIRNPTVCDPTVRTSNNGDLNGRIPSVCDPNVCDPQICAPTGRNSSICAPNVLNTPVQDIKETQRVFGPPGVRRQSFTTVTVSDVEASACACVAAADSCVCPPSDVVAKDIVVTKYSRSLTLVANDGVQTSDHSICFERDVVNQYPLFMKIVCADRLNNVCF